MDVKYHNGAYLAQDEWAYIFIKKITKANFFIF